jgi:hypothetical protein
MALRTARIASAALLAMAAGASADVVVFDQIGVDPSATSGGAVYASQDFPDLPTFNIAAVDDFTTTGGTISTVEAVLGFFNTGAPSFGNVTGYNVQFYTSLAAAAANQAGDAGSVTVAPGLVTITQPWGPTADGRGLVSIPVSGITLGAGTFWVAVQPIMGFATGGQIGPVNSTIGDLNAYQANPGGGFGFPGNMAQIDGDQITPGIQGVNLAYRVSMVVPAPGSLALLGLGGLAAARRRRR